MASFQDQWMAAWQEVAELPVSGERVELQQTLARARELIGEENEPAEKRQGGELIRAARVRAREIAGAAV